ncbi:MAG: hypothetical protein WBL82_12305, partial [Terriglobales bacterium]
MNSLKAVLRLRFLALLFLPVILLTLILLTQSAPVQAKTSAVKNAKKDQKASSAAAARAPGDAQLLAIFEKELHRGQTELSKLDPAPYFVSYNITDSDSLAVIGSQGGILTSTHDRERVADVSMRIGKPDLDNTHGHDRNSGITSGALPIEDDPDAIARTLWHLTYEEYRKASKAYTNAKTKT